MALESGVLNPNSAIDLDEHDQDTTKSSGHKLVAMNNVYHSSDSLHSRGTTMRVTLQYFVAQKFTFPSHQTYRSYFWLVEDVMKSS